MRYVYELTVPADTAKADPAEQKVDLVTGRIKRIEIAFPPGCAAEVKVTILDGLLQISPANPDGYHAWENYTESFSMDFPLDDPAPLLILRGWSPDTVYSHKITFRFDVVPKSGDEREALLRAIASSLAMPGRIS